MEKLLTKDKVHFVSGIIWSNVLIATYRDVIRANKILVVSNAGWSGIAGKACHKQVFSTSWQNDQVPMALGEVLNANLEEYKVPTLADLPEIVNATESMPDDEANALGAKGIGEPPLIPTAAAIANAVFDAVGIRVRELPIRREKLLTAVEQ